MSDNTPENAEAHYVVFKLGPHYFGADTTEIRDVFRPTRITPVPLARPEVLGVLNMRSRIVTAIDVKRILEIDEPSEDCDKERIIVLNRGDEAYALLVDRVLDACRVPSGSRERAHASMPAAWHRCCQGLHKIGDSMMVILDLDRLMSFIDEPVEK